VQKKLGLGRAIISSARKSFWLIHVFSWLRAPFIFFHLLFLFHFENMACGDLSSPKFLLGWVNFAPIFPGGV